MISLFTFSILGKEFVKSEIRNNIQNEPASLLFAFFKTNKELHGDYVIRRTKYIHLPDCEVSE